MTYWAEVRAGVRRSGPVRLVPVEEIGRHSGFRSVFCFDDDTAEMIREQGGTRGLRHVSVYSDVLLLDFDGRESDYFDRYLREQGIAFERYDSGNRSDHYHIPIVPIEGADVPARCKAWVQKHAPTADQSFYHQAGMYRLPGTFHPKQPGQYKRLVAAVSGVLLALSAPAALPPISYVAEQTSDDAKQTFIELMMKPYTRSIGRRPHMFMLAVNGAEAGMEFDEVLDAVLWWNSNMNPEPHAPSAVEQQVHGGFRAAARKRA